MISVDTNVLVRILMEDEKERQQINAARQFAKKQQKLFVTQLVQAELVWVLESAYDLEKIEIINILQHLYENEAFSLQNEMTFAAALHLYQTASVGFSDCLIYIESKETGLDTVTFDKKFGKLPHVKLIGA